jgi:hypothetical protein
MGDPNLKPGHDIAFHSDSERWAWENGGVMINWGNLKKRRQNTASVQLRPSQIPH